MLSTTSQRNAKKQREKHAQCQKQCKAVQMHECRERQTLEVLNNPPSHHGRAIADEGRAPLSLTVSAALQMLHISPDKSTLPPGERQSLSPPLGPPFLVHPIYSIDYEHGVTPPLQASLKLFAFCLALHLLQHFLRHHISVGSAVSVSNSVVKDGFVSPFSNSLPCCHGTYHNYHSNMPR